MKRSIQLVCKAGAPVVIALAALSGCAGHNTALSQRAMPAVDPHAAAILAENVMSTSNGPKLGASDRLGQMLATQHAVYVQRKALQDRMLTGVPAE